jgi:cobalt-zinc-cadmium efflux system outer membrane protein
LSAALGGCATAPERFDALPPPSSYTVRRSITSVPGHPQLAPSAASAIALASATDPPAPSNPPATPTTPPTEQEPIQLTLDKAVGFALENSPTLTAIRTQRGVAAAQVVIARQYPFNPVLQIFELAYVAPRGSENLNRNKVFHEYTMRLDLELRGQGRIRRQGAAATVKRTDWDIAFQEVTVAVAVIRAYNIALHARRKLEVQQEATRLAGQVLDQVQKLVNIGRLRPADLIVARTARNATRAQLRQAESAVATARANLGRTMGTEDDNFVPTGELIHPPPTTDRDWLTQAALQVRPDVNSRRMMVAEAQALYRLTVANRYGNPSIGPAFEYDNDRNALPGIWFFSPIPSLNTRKGEIQLQRAMVSQAIANVKQFEYQAALDVRAALARLTEARKWAESYKTEVLPNLRQAQEELNKLFAQNEIGVDVLKVIGVQQNYLQALGLYLDAQLEVSQGQADLALAVGDPALAMGVYQPLKQPPPIPAPGGTPHGRPVLPPAGPSGGPVQPGNPADAVRRRLP